MLNLKGSYEFGLGRMRHKGPPLFPMGVPRPLLHLTCLAIIDMTQLSMIEMPIISAKDFYSGSVLELSGGPSLKCLGMAHPQNSPKRNYNGALLCIIMNINELN